MLKLLNRRIKNGNIKMNYIYDISNKCKEKKKEKKKKKNIGKNAYIC